MWRRWLGGVVMMALAACGLARQAPVTSSTPADLEVTLQNFGPAPELNNSVWLNASQPLRLSDLRGQVVLIDMWTFG